MFRLALFIAGCVAGYVASGYVDGLLEETEETDSSTSQENAEAQS